MWYSLGVAVYRVMMKYAGNDVTEVVFVRETAPSSARAVDVQTLACVWRYSGPAGKVHSDWGPYKASLSA